MVIFCMGGRSGDSENPENLAKGILTLDRMHRWITTDQR